jgi:hypothetical protein
MGVGPWALCHLTGLQDRPSSPNHSALRSLASLSPCFPLPFDAIFANNAWSITWRRQLAQRPLARRDRTSLLGRLLVQGRHEQGREFGGGEDGGWTGRTNSGRKAPWRRFTAQSRRVFDKKRLQRRPPLVVLLASSRAARYA